MPAVTRLWRSPSRRPTAASTVAVSRTSPRTSPLLVVQHADQAVEVRHRRPGVPERGVEVLAAAVDRHRQLGHEALQRRRACARRTRSAPGRAPAWAPPGARAGARRRPAWAPRGRRATAPRRPPPAASWSAPSRGCRRGSARAASRSSTVASVRWPKRPDRHHLADRHARDPHVRVLGHVRRLAERDLEPVALGLQRHRAAELDPEEQDQAEARERERDRRQDRASAGSLLDLIAPSLVRPTPRNCPSGASRGGRPEAVHAPSAARATNSPRVIAPWASSLENDRGDVVEEPGGPEQVALLGAGRVVGHRVGHPSSSRERALRRSGETFSSPLRGARQVARDGLALAQEGPQLGQRRDSPLSSIPWRGAQRARQLARARGERVQRGGSSPARRSARPRLRRAAAERARQQLHRLAQRGVLARERPQGRVGAAHHVAQVAVARAGRAGDAATGCAPRARSGAGARPASR